MKNAKAQTVVSTSTVGMSNVHPEVTTYTPASDAEVPFSYIDAAADRSSTNGEHLLVAEAIIQIRMRDGEKEFLLRWKDLSAADDSWERGMEANCPELIRQYEALSAVRRRATESEETKGDAEKLTVSIRISLHNAKTTAQPPANTTPSKAKKPVDVTRDLERMLMPQKEYSKLGSAFLVGVVRDYKCKAKEGKYDLRWMNSFFHNHVVKVDLMTVKQGRENYERIQATADKPRWTHLISSTAKAALKIVDDLENLVDYEFSVQQEIPKTLEDVEQVMDASFEPNASLEEPVGLFSRADGSTDTRVQAESRPLFTHSASSSFLAFLPLSFWRQVLEETNAQQDDYLEAQHAEARSTNASVFKIHKVRDIAWYSLDELMKFLGILWFMSLADKREYANYWGKQVEDLIFDTPRLSLDSVMSLRRFRDLLAAFSFRRSSSVTPDDLTRDSAVRIRPLLNMLKQTAAKHIDPGRDLAVDEAMVAARSKFARHLIAYNPRKPTGKYYFKLYMTCCSSTWIALSYRLHGESTLQDRTEGVIDPNATQSLEQEMEMSKRTRQIVLEITQPFHSSGRIINCDNSYTSV